MKLITRLWDIASKKCPGVRVDSQSWIARPTMVRYLLMEGEAQCTGTSRRKEEGKL